MTNNPTCKKPVRFGEKRRRARIVRLSTVAGTISFQGAKTSRVKLVSTMLPTVASRIMRNEVLSLGLEKTQRSKTARKKP